MGLPPKFLVIRAEVEHSHACLKGLCNETLCSQLCLCARELCLGSSGGRKSRREYGRIYGPRGVCLRESSKARQEGRTLKKVTLMGPVDQETLLMVGRAEGMMGEDLFGDLYV